MENFDTKSVSSLFETVSWAEIEKVILKYYSEEEDMLPEFKRMFFKFLNASKIEKEFDNIFFLVSVIPNDQEVYYDEDTIEFEPTYNDSEIIPLTNDHLNALNSSFIGFDDVEKDPDFEYNDALLLTLFLFEIVYGMVLNDIDPYVQDFLKKH